MEITDVKKYLDSLIENADKESQVKIYNRFKSVLEFVEDKPLSSEEIKQIEDKLESLNLKDDAKKKHIHVLKKYSVFTEFLKKEFGYITEGHHTQLGTGLGMSLGMSLGMCFGVPFFKQNGLVFGMLFGMIIGMLFGISYGSKKDKEALEAGNVMPNTKQ